MRLRSLFLALLFTSISMVSYSADIISLVPNDAAVILNVSVSKIAAQKDFKAVFDSVMPSYDNSYNDACTQLGINPFKDIDNIFVFLDSNGRSGLIMDGSFDTITTYETVTGNDEFKKSFQTDGIGGLPVLRNSIKPETGILLVDQCTIAIGEDAVLDIIAKNYSDKDGKNSMKSNRYFNYMVRNLDLNKQIWGATLDSQKISSEIKIQEDGFKNVRISFFDADYNDNFVFTVTSLVARASELPDVTDALYNVLDSLKTFMADVDGASDIIKNAVVQTDGKNLARFYIEMPSSDFVNALSDMARYMGYDNE